MSDLTHFDEAGRPHMVDVSAKPSTTREATARGRVRLSPATVALVAEGRVGKGDVIGIAELAGIMGAKQTSALIPLCHPLSLSAVEVRVTLADPGLLVEATARTTGPTGVEMEALTAVAAACLTIYDMLKAAERGIVIEAIELIAKSGGRSGDWRRGTG
ncbi:cyclic pyranopterin monophosphate synthase MoaC [Sphingomonas sp.]|uniref:cyclic pyranopterin monophosphate synthase MoaC n=1 Tax=Sphingomonas sp. TaxID=28214 RepID=UPI00286A9B7D|nr:cyclic pyranopterin monophosphate synthase MoaC [Sphingomonas sp.]